MLITDERWLALALLAVIAQIPVSIAVYVLITQYTVPYLIFCVLVVAGVYAYLKVNP